MDLNQIISQIKDSGHTAYKIAEHTLLTEVGINKILNGTSTNPRQSTLKMLEDYITCYINNPDKPNLLKEDSEEYYTEAKKIDINEKNVMYVPLVNQYAHAGYINGYADMEFIEELPKIPFTLDREHKGEYICFEVKGDSMDDGSHESYLERDILLCRNVRKEYWKSKLHINKWDFVIVHKEKGICVKRIIEHDVEKGLITCHSFNDYYKDFVIDLRDVNQIFNIVDVQRKRNRR